MKINSTKLMAVATAILMASTSAFAAVKNGASLKGTEYTKGGNNAKGGGVIAWNSYSSLDPTAFSHDLSSSDLTVLKDGDYLVAVTVPISTINSQRNTHRADLLVNGTAVPTGVGESSYIRFASGHSESSDHFAVLVALKANDALTVQTTPTAQTGGASFIATCSLYAELVEGDRNVFSASATEIQSGTNLNVEPDIGDQGLVWTSARKGSAYTHSDGDAGITFKDDGNYMVYANVPLHGVIVRGSVGLTLNLDEEYIWGARGQQGYIRNANSHQDASIHFSGMIRAEAGQVLTVTTEQLAAAGTVTVQSNRAASIFIEKVRNDGLFSDYFTETTAGENLNPNNKFALSLVGDGESLDIIDGTTYANEGDSEENIVIKKAGSYLLSFNSTFTGGSLRANPRVTVEVNGSVVPGATSLAHYNRHANGHDETTGSFVALLSDLAVDDVVTVSVQREGNGGTVTAPEGGRVALQAKAAYETAAGDQSPPRFTSFSGGLDGFSAVLEDSGLKLDAATLKATLNGEVVDVTVDSANGVNSINYAFAAFPATGSEHALNIAFNDTGGNAHSKDFAFTVTTQYQTVSPAISMSDVNKDKAGFRVNLTQISVMQTEGPNNLHGNLWGNAEKQLRGEYLNPNEVDDDDNPLPYLNEADPDAWEGWSIAPADVDYVNMNQDEGAAIGNFGEDQPFPNIPGWGDSSDGIAGEFLTVLHLKKGFQTLGVNSDDGFRATVGLNFHDMEAQQIGLFDGGRGAADSLFNIVVTEEGYYPLRVLWWEGGGGANIEIFSIEDGKKVLLNDPDNENAIKAYNIGNSTGRTYFGSVSPARNDTFASENSISATIIEDGTKAKSGSIKVLFNGEEVDASINSADGVITVTAEPDGGLGIGSHTAKIVFTETTDPETERSFEWSFEVTAFSTKMRDLVDGEPNPIAYWDFDFTVVPDLTFEHVFNLESVMTNAKYTEDKGGHTGETGDYAMDFLQGAANLLVPDGEFLNIASAFDKITVSLWQKNHTTPNSSSFWGYSPSSNGSFRGIQAHIPWGNLQIYFDTAGCCGAATQRINMTASADHEWTEWHHYVFVKDKGHKSIWIDGTLFHEGDNSLELPSDFDFLYIGGNQTGANSTSGIIDDFAVFASALTEEQIIALSEGNTDILPEKREIVVPQPDIPILLSKSPTGAGPVGEDEISIRFRGIDFTDLSITVNDKAVDPTTASDAMFTTITADGAFSLGENVITVSWNGESETWNYFQFTVAEGQTGLASYSVQTVGAVPGPWTFEGLWVSGGSVAGCGGPYHDFLTSPNYIVSADGEVTLSFEHRHSFEPDMYDGAQLRIRVNGSDYTDVGIDAFTANGYQEAVITGNGIIKGQQAFGLTSAGYADGNYITTVATLGTFAAGDAISVQFLAAYDDCATGTNPNWVIKSVSSDQMAIKPIEGGLVAHWPLNEGSGDVFRDVVGRFDGFLPLAQDGARTEISWSDGPPTQENSVEFSGANSFIATRFPGIGGSEPRTVAFWVRTTDANAFYMAWGSNATARKWHIRANGGSGVMRTEYAGGQNFATTSIIDGEWHHVASVFPNGATEGEQILHYIDGVLDPQAGGTSLTIDTEIVTDADIDWTNANSAESYPVHIGARLTHGWGSMLTGSMADVRIYNQGLSEEQIRAIFEGEAPEPDLTLSAEDMKYDAQGASIALDGDASDWADAEFKSQIPFEKGGELVLFEEYGGGTWSGPADHSSAVAFAWDAESLYVGVVVTDDTHQNPGDGWNGDSIQMVFANAAQDTVTHLYNYGLSDAGDVVIHNERGPGGSEVSITRDDDTTTTFYEFNFPAASLGLDGYESGMSIGIGLCVNDGDTEAGQGGQKGWSGWGPYSAVYGKTASATGLVTLVGEAPGPDLTLSAEDMKYDAQGASIALDGDASDWADAEFKSQIPFEKGGELVLFEEYGGGTWSGPADHSSAVAFAWDAESLYVGVVVTDDTHQNPGDGWNGDSIQMVFANAAQDTVTHLYNYGLSDAGDVVIHNERGPGGSEVSITRDDDTTTTFYEFNFPAASLGLDGYESGMSIGIGLCVNDGDTEAGQGGQKGWSGWGPYSAVYGKTASATGLVTLVGEAPGPDLTLSAEDMKYDAQGASIALDGDASDWADAEFKSQIPFEKGGELVLFEEYGGGTWSGPADHSSAVAFAWDAESLYVGVVVTDDTHQNPGDGWNGDSIQMVFANAAQDTVTHLYNYGLSDAGDVVIHNERGPGGSEVSITRDDDTTTTFYEFNFPAASLGLDGYESGMSIGIGLCVNDGDTEAGQGGQKGWSGWGPYSAVYGKTASATGLVTLVGEAPGPDLTLSAEDMKYDAQGASIALDGDASDWADAEFKSQIPFEKGGELVLFEEYGGGTWSGPADHSSAVAFAWDAESLYVGVVVTDDTHQNPGDGWNGDSIQMVFANAAQDTVTHLYNYGLSDAGDVVIHNERGPGGSEVSITRDDDTTTTFYEFNFPAASLGLDGYESGMSIGIGLCVNDGDTEAGQGGQKGWSGWGPYSAVYGKTASATGLVTLVGEAPGPDLTLSAEDMKYDAQGASIALDGDASDWADAEFKSQIPFEKGGELVLFEEYGGGTWSGPADHSSAVAFAWDAESLYVGVVVTDDTHQNPGDGWNGDSIQMVFANAAQDTVTHLYNYGLSDAGDVVIHNERGPGGSEVSITRDDDTTTTFYEFNFPAASLGLDGYESGMSIGIGLCVNDGDTEAGQGGQKGWSGWGPYSAVYGKTASATGLVTLVGEAPGPDLTLSAEDMKYDAQGASIALDGDASDWADAEFKSQIPFEKGGELVLFEEYGGGTWSGPADHSSAVAFAWDAESLYVGVVVTDDTHQNPGDGWNGDSIQMVFANAAQDTVTHLYNYGLSDAGDVVIHNERGPGGSEVSITRDDDTTTTLYEFAFPAASLGLDGYESGMSIGIGLCVNDGDTEAGQGGQKGWSGWGPYSAVYGKTASATGLVTLVGEAPHAPGPEVYVDAVPADKGGNTVSLADQEEGGWYEPEEPTAKWPPAGDGRWFWYSGDGGISPDGEGKGKAVENALFAMYSNYPAPPALQTTITGLEESGLYDVYVHFIAADWVAGKYGIKAGFAGDELELFTDAHADVINTELPGGGIPTFKGFIGNTGAVGGKIVVEIDISGVERSYYAGLSYSRTGYAAGGDTPSISVARNVDGTLTVTFEGKLQAAPTVNGPWQDVTDESPYNLTPDQAQAFGRAVK